MLLKRKRVLAAAIESTVGTAEALNAAAAAFNVFDAMPQANIEYGERPGQSAFSPLPGVPGARGGTITFAVELHGSGSVLAPKPAWAEVFFPACGLVDVGDTDVFLPSSAAPADGADSTAVRTITIGVYENGMLKKLRGCMGNAVFTFEAGKPVRIEFTFTGLWDAPTDVAILAPTYPTVIPPRYASSVVTIGAWQPAHHQITIDLGNQVMLREDPADVTGYRSAAITMRRITGTMDPESDLVGAGTNDPYTLWLAQSEPALSIEIPDGSADGNRILVDAGNLQITNVQEADREDLQTDEVSFVLNRVLAAGDDELSIQFT